MAELFKVKIVDWIRDTFKKHGSKTALIEHGETWTYSEILEELDEAASGLVLGKALLPLDTDSTAKSLAQLLAIAGSEHIAVFIPSELPEPEKKSMEAIAGLGSPSPPELYQKLNSSGLVLFSSGTTGGPKGMLHDLTALLSRYKQVKPRQDRTLQLLPIDHIGGLDAALRCLLAGSTLILPEARTPEAAGRAIEQHKVNILPVSPTFLNLMLIQGIPDKYDCSSLEIIAYGAETMPPSLLSRVVEAFPDADLQQKFGTSETGTVRIQSQRRDSTYFRFKDSDTEWKSVDGVLWLKTPSRIIGYLNADNSSLESEGWYCTGDMVEETEDGFLKITSRREDLINVGGEKVTPAEVESTLLEIPEIDDCLVYGEDNAITGQIVAAKVVPGEGVDPDQLKRQIKKYCRSKLSTYKIPARIIICDQTSFSSRFKKMR